MNDEAIKPLNILVADDFEEMRDLISHWLTADGHAVETAADGAEALARLAVERFDLVITDMVMPGCDGVGLIREVRLAHPETRIIAISGTDGYVEAKASGCGTGPTGADDALVKPFTYALLTERISLLFRAAAASLQTPRSPTAQAAAAAT